MRFTEGLDVTLSGFEDIDLTDTYTISLPVCPFQKRILDGSLGFAAGVSCIPFEQTCTHTYSTGRRMLCCNGLLEVLLWQAGFLPETHKA